MAIKAVIIVINCSLSSAKSFAILFLAPLGFVHFWFLLVFSSSSSLEFAFGWEFSVSTSGWTQLVDIRVGSSSGQCLCLLAFQFDFAASSQLSVQLEMAPRALWSWRRTAGHLLLFHNRRTLAPAWRCACVSCCSVCTPASGHFARRPPAQSCPRARRNRCSSNFVETIA